MDKEFLNNKTETSGCSLDEYKYVYPRLMNKHITTGVPGRNELQFIRREIENHTIILEGLKKTMLKISDFDYRRKNFDPIEETFGQEKFLNTMASHENMRDNHELIIEYLETKKSVLKNNLVSTTQQPDPIDLLEKSGVEKNRIIIKEPYGEIFSNNGYELFDYILNECVKPKEKIGRKSDLIYFYWEMYNSKTQYIHQRPASFFEWYEKKYNETTGQLKTYDNVKTDQRIKDFSTALEWFKLKEK